MVVLTIYLICKVWQRPRQAGKPKVIDIEFKDIGVDKEEKPRRKLKKRYIILLILLVIGLCVAFMGKWYTRKDIKILSMDMAQLKDPWKQAASCTEKDFIFSDMFEEGEKILFCHMKVFIPVACDLQFKLAGPETVIKNVSYSVNETLDTVEGPLIIWFESEGGFKAGDYSVTAMLLWPDTILKKVDFKVYKEEDLRKEMRKRYKRE
jgi:hypothetical protein